MDDDEILEELDQPDAPVLGHWRKLRPSEARSESKDLETCLIARARPFVEASILEDVEHGDRYAPVHALWRLSETDPRGVGADVSGSWLMLAALREPVPLASRRLAELLCERAAQQPRSDAGNKRAARLASLAAGWLSRWLLDPSSSADAYMLAAAFERYRQRYAGRFTRAGGGRVLPDTTLLSATMSSVPTHLVLDAIGDPDSKEGRDISRHYRVLIEPLPLKGANVSVDVLAIALEREFPWMSEVTTRILMELKLRRRCGVPWFRIRPLLLVGPPGVGKTRYAQRLSRLAGTGYGDINAGGASDNRMLQGTARGYASAQPALPVLVIARFQTANPIIVVDEVDKVTSDSRNGDLHATLLALLEPESARRWPDECLLGSCDLSGVTWILTANDLSRIPEPLKSRVTTIRVGLPRAEDFDALVYGIRNDLAEELQVNPDQLPELEPEAEEHLRDAFRQGLDVRRLRAAMERAIAAGASETPVLN